MKPVVFAIPLASRTDAESWESINQNLSFALRSILRQTDPNLTVLIACHDRPSCQEMYDPRVTFIEMKGERANSPDQYIIDKSRKRRALAQAMKERGSGYMVMHDGDDILHRRLVEYIRKVNSPHGYTYATGFVMDFQARFIAEVPGIWNKPFSHVCGSSAVIWFDPQDFDAPARPEGTPTDDAAEKSYFRKFQQHAYWVDVARNEGRPLHEVPFPCCIYMQNNGTNISALLQRKDGRLLKMLKSIRENAIQVTPEFAADFSLDWIWPPAAGRKGRKPEVPIGTPVTQAAQFLAHHIDVQRLLSAQQLPDDQAENAKRRRAGAARLATAVIEVVKTLAPATILEVGAHEAAFALTMKQALPSSRVVAFEANPDVHKQHLAILQAAGVESVQSCISDTEGRLTFNVPVKRQHVKATMGSVLLDSQADDHIRHDVAAITLDGFLGPDASANALWIDVEGAVRQVLAGAREALNRCVALFAELETSPRWPGQALAHDVLPLIAEAGLVPLLSDTQREWQFNVLFVRPSALANPAITEIVRNFYASSQTP